jgi:hypothetical protein
MAHDSYFLPWLGTTCVDPIFHFCSDMFWPDRTQRPGSVLPWWDREFAGWNCVLVFRQRSERAAQTAQEKAPGPFDPASARPACKSLIVRNRDGGLGDNLHRLRCFFHASWHRVVHSVQGDALTSKEALSLKLACDSCQFRCHRELDPPRHASSDLRNSSNRYVLSCGPAEASG